MIQVHQIKPSHKRKEKKRVGRGGKRGTYSGRGIKGQKSRAGNQGEPMIRRLIKRYPKKRGYRFSPVRPKPITLNLNTIEKKFETNTKITPQALFEAGLIRRIKGKVPPIKILGRGRISKSFIIENCKVSKTVQEKIEKAGGRVNF